MQILWLLSWERLHDIVIYQTISDAPSSSLCEWCWGYLCACITCIIIYLLLLAQTNVAADDVILNMASFSCNSTLSISLQDTCTFCPGSQPHTRPTQHNSQVKTISTLKFIVDVFRSRCDQIIIIWTMHHGANYLLHVWVDVSDSWALSMWKYMYGHIIVSCLQYCVM